MKKGLQKAQHNNFIAWDGEGENVNGSHRLILLANSLGEIIVDKERKGKFTYKDWLPFIASHQDATNIWYSFQYDVNMIFKDLDPELKIQLFQEQKRTDVDGYVIKYIPRKILTITHKGNTTTHYDTFGFFQTSFLKTLNKWNIEIPEIINEGKELRQDFTKQQLDFIIKYNYAECEKLVEVISRLEKYIEHAHIPPLRSWHGAGAIASRFLDSWNFKEHKTNLRPTPRYQSLFDARKYSYFGGHSELFFRGLINGPVYQYDINSAYPNACRFIPSLKDARWHHTNAIKDIHEDDFALIHVSWKLDESTRLGPLPFRINDNTIIYPRSGEGWYHNVEVQSALRKGYKLKLIEAWILEKPYYYFINEEIDEMAQKRLALKKKKDLGHMPLKLGLNALYGKVAQKPILRESGTYRYGKYTDLFLAGFITAHTRAAIMDALDVDNVIMIATDGIFSKVSLKVKQGENLGEWEFTEHKNGNFLLSGVYALQDQEDVWHLKTRGYTSMTIEEFQRIHKKQVMQEEVKFKEYRFISIRLNLRSPKYKQAEFQEIERVLNWNNNKKRIFKFPEDESSDSISVDRPPNQPFSKMYNPIPKEMEIQDESMIELAESIPHEEI